MVLFYVSLILFDIILWTFASVLMWDIGLGFLELPMSDFSTVLMLASQNETGNILSYSIFQNRLSILVLFIL